MLTEFNVLKREQKIHNHCLLEASAGTGKTFAVENLVVRLLIEEGPSHDPLTLDQILVVTFTRAAARDLKKRIRSKLDQSRRLLTLREDSPISSDFPDYLQKILEKGERERVQACRYIEKALFCFDQAQIFTIHGFCHRLLQEHVFESGAGMDGNRLHQPLTTEKMLQIVQDYLRLQVQPALFSPTQFSQLASNQDDLDDLKRRLLKEISKGHSNQTLSNFKEQFHRFCQLMTELRSKGYIHAVKIVEDFEALAPFYKEICDKKGAIKTENLTKVARMAQLFDKSSWTERDFDIVIEDGLYICEALQPEQMKAKKNPQSQVSLHYPQLLADLKQNLMPLVLETRDKELNFIKMASQCQNHFDVYMQQEELKHYNDLLKEMHKATFHQAFIELIHKKYKAAIIDEFQDTDPLQWEIFEKLFLKHRKDFSYLYLVGDPKQSIYSFRQADIYTYLKAGEQMGSGQIACLNTNYRSQPQLVEALNFLFSACNDFIPLPRLGSHLEYRQVRASEKIIPRNLQDDKGSLHFFGFASEKKYEKKQVESLESQYLFPFIINELFHLYHQGIPLKSMAILVADRYQGHRVVEALKKQGLPCIAQHNSSLAETTAVESFQELLKAVITPKEESAIKLALGGSIIGWTHDRLLQLSDPILYEEVLLVFYEWHNTLFDKGFLHFINALMDSVFPEEKFSIAENLLRRKEGIEFYQDLLQLFEVLMDQKNLNSPDVLLKFIDHFRCTQKEEEEQGIKQRPNPDLEGVNVLTTHSSKGLEYEVVFALGLTKRPGRAPEKKYLDTSSYPPRMIPILDESSKEYLQVCQESEAEKMRLLYVALTRAKQRVYVPVLFFPNNISVKMGMRSPIELLLAKIGKEEFAAFHPWLESEALKLSSITWSDVTKTQFVNEAFSESRPESLLPPEEFAVFKTNEGIYSYSSLTKPLNHIRNEDVEFFPPHDKSADSKNSHTLPAGAEVGILLHKLMETVPLGGTSSQEIQRIVGQEVRGLDYEGWQEVLKKMVESALNAFLETKESRFCLNDIDPKYVYRETEFLFPWSRDLKIEELEFCSLNGYLKGVIDLIFRHEGRYYILDWKSNWLGPSSDYYTQEAMEKAMRQHYYFIQARIYKEALKAYLKKVDPRPFDTIFGGLFYVFLRGVGTHSDSLGIYTIK